MKIRLDTSRQNWSNLSLLNILMINKEPCINFNLLIVKYFIARLQPNKKIYDSFEKLINSINQNWIFLYIFWKLTLLRTRLWYNLVEHLNSARIEEKFLKIKIDGFIYEIPNYLIQQKIPENFNNLLIRKSLLFTRQVMQNKFFIPNNLKFPKSRVILENYFN